MARRINVALAISIGNGRACKNYTLVKRDFRGTANGGVTEYKGRRGRRGCTLWMRHERGNQHFGLRCSETRHVIVSRKGIAQNATGAICASGDGVEISAQIGLRRRVESNIRDRAR